MDELGQPTTGTEVLNWTQRLRRAGIRVTPQRLAIVEALHDSRDHLSAEALLLRVRTRLPGASLATVYRSLDTLRDAGIIHQGRLGEQRNFYETNVEPHFHFVCQRCHAVEDLEPMKADALRREIADTSGHLIRSCRLELFGLCRDCRDPVPPPLGV